MDINPTENPVFAEALLPMHHGLTALRRASECLLQGFMDMAAKQAEFGQTVMLEAFAELQDLSRIRAPDEFLQSEFTHARNRAERSINAFRALSDDMRHCYFDAVDVAVNEIGAALPAAAAETPAAAPKRAARPAAQKPA